MRITGVETVLLTGPSSNDPWINFAKTNRTAAFVELHTDRGLVGIGETYAGYFAPELVAPMIDYVRPILLSAETLDPQVLATRMRRCLGYIARVGVAAGILAAVEAALWDLAGKAQGVPVHQLLPGSTTNSERAPDSLPAYATGGPSPWPADMLRRKMDRYLELGYSALKVATGYMDMTDRRAVLPGDGGVDAIVAQEVEKVAMMREHVGPDVGLILDGHMGARQDETTWTVDVAAEVMRALEPYSLDFFEEPLPYVDPDSYAELVRRSPIPIAGGEQLSSFGEYQLWLGRDAFDVAQPDASWLGLGEFVQVAQLAADRGHQIATHAWCAGVGVMQNVHGAFAAPSPLVIELPPDAGELHTLLWGESLQVEHGRVLRPDAPGLGVTLNDDIKNRFPFRPGNEEFASVPGKVLSS